MLCKETDRHIHIQKHATEHRTYNFTPFVRLSVDSAHLTLFEVNNVQFYAAHSEPRDL